MKNAIYIALLLLISQSLCAGTIITGALAESLYNLIPNAPVRHYSPRLMDIKAPAIGLHCAKRINTDETTHEISFDYKCLLPTKDHKGEINIGGEAGEIIFGALSSNPESANNLSGKIRCTAHREDNNKIYHCVITP